MNKPRYFPRRKTLGLWFHRSYRYQDAIGWVCRSCRAHTFSHYLDPRPRFCGVCGNGSRRIDPRPATMSRSDLSSQSEQPDVALLVCPAWGHMEDDPFVEERSRERIG